MSEPKCELRVHLTNVTAVGPAQVVKSLLPALEALQRAAVEDIYLPDRGELATYVRTSPGPPPATYRRVLPRALSRVLECTLLARQFDGPTPILVLGDVPLRCDSLQVVFVQTSHLCEAATSEGWRRRWTHDLARLLLRLNARRVGAFVVQTELMKDMLERVLPAARGKVTVISQPAPSWLIESGLRRVGRRDPDAVRLDLLYPADGYPHKNHALLGRILPEESDAWPVARLTLTIDPKAHPNPGIGWLDCAGFPVAAAHDGSVPGARHGDPHDPELHHHELDRGPGAVAARRPAHRLAHVRLLLRDHGGYDPAGGAGGLCRRPFRRRVRDEDRRAGGQDRARRFIIPFMAVYTPALLLQTGGWLEVTYITFKVLIAIGLWGVAAVGYWLVPVNWFERIFAFTAAAFLIAAVPLTDEIGFALAAAFAAWHVFRARSARRNAQPARPA